MVFRYLGTKWQSLVFSMLDICLGHVTIYVTVPGQSIDFFHHCLD